MRRISVHRVVSRAIACLSMITLSMGASAPQPQRAQDPPELQDVARLIASLPEWPAGRDLSKEEWRLYVFMAIALQKTPPETVRDSLRAYRTFMRRYRQTSPMKAVILLRVMFEIPEDFELLEYPYGVVPCGGPFATSVTGGPAPRNLAAPVRWTPDGPTLSAYPPSRGVGFTGPRPRVSIADREFDYFRKQFHHRPGLEVLADGEVTGWRDLLPILGGELTQQPEAFMHVWWIEASLDRSLRVVMHRLDPETVEMSVEHRAGRPVEIPAMSFTVLLADDAAEKAIAEIALDGGVTSGLTRRRALVPVDQCCGIRIRIHAAGRAERTSATYVP